MKIIRRIYDWVLQWADTPYAVPALFVLAFTESSFFPIPPDVLLITLAIARPAKAYWYAFVSSVGSVLGGAFGYLIGLTLMDAVGNKIIGFYGFEEQYLHIQRIYMDYDAAAVAIAGFSPIPYKIFTIAAGAFEINFWVFIVASAVSRSARFFILSFIIHRWGDGIKVFIDKYFNLLTVVFTVMLVLGFVLIKIFAGE